MDIFRKHAKGYKTVGSKTTVFAFLYIVTALALGFTAGRLTKNQYIYPKSQQIVAKTDSAIMTLIPAGSFIMGSQWHNRHKVFVEDFFIDNYEVTNAQFVNFLNSTSLEENFIISVLDTGISKTTKNKKTYYSVSKDQALYPVTGVTWYGAEQYCKWAGKRLPNEAEWEKACLAGEINNYSIGNYQNGLSLFFEFNHSPVDKYAWNAINSGDKPKMTGLKYPNHAGIYDMRGNALEWVYDTYDQYYFKKFQRDVPISQYKVLKGGSYLSYSYKCSCSARFYSEPDNPETGTGFRCAVSRERYP